MKSYDFYAVIYFDEHGNGDVFCVECLPPGTREGDDNVHPIFADAEMETVPVCCVCGNEHDYMTILHSVMKKAQVHADDGKESCKICGVPKDTSDTCNVCGGEK